MIAAVVMWLAMAGQGGPKPCQQLNVQANGTVVGVPEGCDIGRGFAWPDTPLNFPNPVPDPLVVCANGCPVCTESNGNMICPLWTQTSPEHVIEIRTKRTLDRVKIYSCRQDTKYFNDPDFYCGHKMPSNFCPDGQNVHDFERTEDAVYRECEHATKTLYIDGQLVGVIRETEEK